MKHINGPWRVLLYGGTRVDVIDSSRPEQPVYCNTVAICYRDASDLGFRFTPPKEQAEANAQLIAAAPELLEACQHALLLLSGLSTDGEITMTPDGKDAITEQLRSAITKAEGRLK